MAKDYTNWKREDLLNEIEQLKKRKKYGLVWEEKAEDVVEQCKKELPVLEEIVENEVVIDKQKQTNILIEGDNYHALSVLNFTHKGKVDVIYIDPPYNTGNKDFTYNDQYIDSEDPYKHSKWISFMSERLKLARKLLKETGVIFISIDDNEQAQLKILCDSVFGENNFIETLIWKKRATPPNDRPVGRIHEYIHIYSKSPEYYLGLLPRDEKSIGRYKNPDNDPRGPWVASDLSANGKGGRLVKSCIYPIRNPDLNKDYYPSEGRCWLFNREKMNKWIDEGRVSFRGQSGAPFLKRYLSEVRQGVTLPTILLDQGFSSNSSSELESIFGEKGYFEYPKPLRLITNLLKISTKQNSIILDFMAGSGTTGQAVLELNREDGGNRQFILCTNNENGIAERVCLQRLKRVIKGYDYKGEIKTDLFVKKIEISDLSDIDLILEEFDKQKEMVEKKYDRIDLIFEDCTLKLCGIRKAQTIKEGVGGNLRYYRTKFVPADLTDKNKVLLTNKAIELLCIKEGTFNPVLIKKEFKIYKSEDKYTGILFDTSFINEFKNELVKFRNKKNVYIFSLSGDSYEDEFMSFRDVVLSPIPESILKVYRRLFI